MFFRRWSRRSKLFAVLAVAAGAASFSLVRSYATELERLRPAPGGSTTVIVAAAALARGTVLAEADMRTKRLPAAYAPPGAIGSMSDAVGRTLVSDLAEDEIVTETRLGAGGGPVASALPSGLRAFVVPAGVPAGVLRAGDRVDVIATFGGPHPYAETVGTGLEVLSIIDQENGTFEAGGSSGPSLVLLVSPDTAERLAYATAFAQISVTVAPAID